MSAPRDSEASVARDTATLRRALRTSLREFSRRGVAAPFLVVLSGLPGTGKSYFAGELVKQVPFVVVGSDRCRKALVSRPRYTKGEHARVFAACHRLIEELLTEGYRVIFDATNLTERFRQPLYDIAGRTGAGLVLVWFTAPPKVVRRRLEDRAAGVTSDSYSDADWVVYCRLRPGEEVMARPHVTVDSSRDIAPALEEVVSLVKSGRKSP